MVTWTFVTSTSSLAWMSICPPRRSMPWITGRFNQSMKAMWWADRRCSAASPA
jgi:hypothetical protein